MGSYSQIELANKSESVEETSNSLCCCLNQRKLIIPLVIIFLNSEVAHTPDKIMLCFCKFSFTRNDLRRQTFALKLIQFSSYYAHYNVKKASRCFYSYTLCNTHRFCVYYMDMNVVVVNGNRNVINKSIP